MNLYLIVIFLIGHLMYSSVQANGNRCIQCIDIIHQFVNVSTECSTKVPLTSCDNSTNGCAEFKGTAVLGTGQATDSVTVRFRYCSIDSLTHCYNITQTTNFTNEPSGIIPAFIRRLPVLRSKGILLGQPQEAAGQICIKGFSSLNGNSRLMPNVIFFILSFIFTLINV
ncbi:uncharacterized protein LOC134697314 [Mytilus trossulus]|uniref:uncharacterized protein LOC134697314 n=1 Tax=Mytilus trossulus TaxID=6551 RepID=UPI0030054268